MELYRVAYQVTPTPCHPKYWEIGGGYLSVFVFDESQEAATSQAFQVIKALKVFEIGPDGSDLCSVFVGLAEDDIGTCHEHYEHARREAEHLGVAFFLDCFPTGRDNASLPGEDAPASE